MLVGARDVLSGCLDTLDYSVSILISLPLNLFLDVFRVVSGKAIWLKLEVIVEFSQILDEVVHCLRLLLLLCQRHLEYLA